MDSFTAQAAIARTPKPVQELARFSSLYPFARLALRHFHSLPEAHVD